MKKIIAILSIIILDQLTKGILLHLLTGGIPLTGAALELVPNPVFFAQITSFFNLVFTWNPGASFSMLTSVGETNALIMIFLTAAITGFFGYILFTKKLPKLETAALTMIVAGAIGNIIDRVRFGAVVDFLDFHLGDWHWPSFNVADIAISVGILIYAYALIRNKNGKNTGKK